MQTPIPKEQISYTQVVDEKTGEIKYVPNNPPQPDPKKASPKQDNTDEDGVEFQSEYNEIFEAIKKVLDTKLDEKLVETLKRLEDNNKRLRYAKRLKSGKIDGRRLCAYKTSEQLFKKKAIKHKNYKFTIMMDTSGSMLEHDPDKSYDTMIECYQNSKLKVSIESVIKVVKALEELDLPVSVMAMNQEVRLLKEFGVKLDYDDFLRRLKLNFLGAVGTRGERNMGGTNEMVAYKETIAYIDRTTNQNTKQENIVLVLSDGEPGGLCGSVDVHLEDQVKQQRNSKSGEDEVDTLKNYWEHQNRVAVYGIGIMSSARQIPRSMRLNSVETLPEFMSNLIQEIIL